MTFNIRKILCLAVFGALAAQPAVAQTPTVWYVDAGYTGTPENGESWDTPFNTIEEAIAQADENAGSPRDQIWVKAGTYTPSNITSGFTIKRDVEVYGGFVGNEVPVENFEENDPRAFDPVTGMLQNVTILNGEVPPAGFSDNVAVIVTAPSDDANYILDGFTIQGAKSHAISAVGTGQTGSSGTFRNLIVQDNQDDGSTFDGGLGIIIDGTTSNPSIERCTFARNEFGQDLGLGGGALFCGVGASARISDTRFEDNYAEGGIGGGAVLFYESANVVLRRCDFVGNTVVDKNGGAASFQLVSDGNAMTQDVIVVDCKFNQNRVRCHTCQELLQGGAVFDHTGGRYINCEFTNNLVETRFIDEEEVETYEIDGEGGAIYMSHGRIINAMNCLFTRNAAAKAGAVYLTTKNQEFPGGGNFTNCTFSLNDATGGPFATAGDTSGGIYIESNGERLHVTNSILWGNSGGFNGDTVASQVFAGTFQSPTTPDVDYSCVEDDTPGSTPIPFGSPNIDTYPGFADPDGADDIAGTDDDDFRLTLNSDCIDAGDNSSVPEDDQDVDQDGVLVTTMTEDGEPTPDLDKTYRLKFGDDVMLSTETCEGVVDMGAYEFNVACPLAWALDTFGDMNDDAVKDGLDIQQFIDCLLSTSQDCICARGDFYGTSTDGVTVEDIPGFVDCLLTGDCGSETCPLEVGGTRTAPPDCNNNGIRDDVDIFLSNGDPSLSDCNGNGIPDGCDIENGTTPDANENSIPDSCDPDCNGNGIPDDLDIANCTSDPDCADCNSNGVPDGCDQDCDDDGTPDDCQTLIDCNSNGIYDPCESDDCDGDLVPDACELSGNDCNGNNFPDDCEIDFPPPWNLADCNNDNVPDVCQLSGQDCNENGILDECDISTGQSDDTNTNGIPDECEQQQAQGGGGGSSMMMAGGSSSSPSSGLSEAEAWDGYFAWCHETDFSEMNHAEVFSACLAKRLELGLPAGQMLPE